MRQWEQLTGPRHVPDVTLSERALKVANFGAFGSFYQNGMRPQRATSMRRRPSGLVTMGPFYVGSHLLQSRSASTAFSWCAALIFGL